MNIFFFYVIQFRYVILTYTIYINLCIFLIRLNQIKNFYRLPQLFLMIVIINECSRSFKYRKRA